MSGEPICWYSDVSAWNSVSEYCMMCSLMLAVKNTSSIIIKSQIQPFLLANNSITFTIVWPLISSTVLPLTDVKNSTKHLLGGEITPPNPSEIWLTFPNVVQANQTGKTISITNELAIKNQYDMKICHSCCLCKWLENLISGKNWKIV